MASVSFKEIKKDFGKVKVLHGISLEISDGEFTILYHEGPPMTDDEIGPADPGPLDPQVARPASVFASSSQMLIISVWKRLSIQFLVCCVGLKCGASLRALPYFR